MASDRDAGQVRVNFDMAAADVAAVDAAAHARGMTRAAWVREVIVAAASGTAGYRLPEPPEGKRCVCAFVDAAAVSFDEERFRRATSGPAAATERMAAAYGPVLERALSERPRFGQVAGAAMRGPDELARVAEAAGPEEVASTLAVLRHELDYDYGADPGAWFAPAVAALEAHVGEARR